MTTDKINFWSVKTFRSVGFEARWTKTSKGTPCIVIRNPAGKSKHQRESWWMVDRSMAEAMEQSGIEDGFDRCTLLGDLFSVHI